MKRIFLRACDAVAMHGTNWQTTYSELYSRIISAAAKMKFQDSPEESRLDEFEIPKVAIYADNSPDWVCALYAAWSKGAAVVPIDAKSPPEEAAFILEDSSPQTFFVSRENLKSAEAAVKSLSYTPQLLVLEDLFEELGDSPAGSGGILEFEEDAVALIVYTSGTTGVPKGVVLTFANMWANMQAVAEAGYYSKGIRVLALLPFHHILPLMGTLIMPLSVEGKLVFPKSLSPADMSEVMQKCGVDMVIGVPRFYEMLHSGIMSKIRASRLGRILFFAAKLAGNQRLSRILFSVVHKKFGGEVKFWISGGASLDKKIWQDLDALGFAIREGYGMTECAPIITFPRIGRVRMGSPGEALPSIEIRIEDSEICVRGKNVTRGYYKRPEETAQTIRGGWLYTGDLGYLDKDGFLFITGRRKEIIVLPNGKNLDPAEMESRLKAQSQDVLEAAVLMHDGLLQSVIRVSSEFISESGGIEGAREKVRSSIILPYNRSAAAYKRIIKFTLTSSELPRTRVGKLKRYRLAECLKSESDGVKNARPAPDSKIYNELAEVVASQISVPVLADAHIEMDLGLDSLGKITLLCNIKENYGLEISERDFEKFSTLRSLAEYVEKKCGKGESAKQSGKISWQKILRARPFPSIPKTQPLHFLTIDFFKILTRLMYRVHISGLENVPDKGPVILAPNHQSYCDGLYVCLGFTKSELYKTYFFAKLRSYLKGGILRKFARSSNVVIMDINDNVNESIRQIAAALEKGGRAIIFPEGTRTKDGDIGEFKQTFAILAKEMGARVVPVAIRGAYEALKPGATFPSPRADIYVQHLPAMTPLDGETYSGFAARVRAAVEKAWEGMKTLPMKCSDFRK